MNRSSRFYLKIKKFFKVLGPGLITGASDDDPSGIATYSQAGAQFGLATLWTALITFPLMAAVQGMCARIGLVTSQGLTSTLKQHYPKPVLYLMVIFSFPAIILNIGADIAGMGAVANLVFPKIHAIYFTVGFTALLILFIVYMPYKKIVAILKYLTLAVLLYILVPFFTKPDWGAVLKSTFIPTIRLDREFIGILVAILGTTISPYLFFWQATMEAEDIQTVNRQVMVNKRILLRETATMEIAKIEARKRWQRLIGALLKKVTADVNIGMLLSNMVMFFIILATGTALFSNGGQKIETVEQAAKALEPVAGKASYWLFSIGVIGTGFLAIPVLCGSLSYIFSETFGWKGSLDKKFHQAKPFYAVIIISLIIGLLINYIGISPIQALLYTAILYGITSPVIIAVIMHIGNNRKIMGTHTNSLLSNILGALTFLLMTASAVFLIYLQFDRT
jgi:NRAMP (natural resistance-associated macrophage protein)-like metal ion transporter